MHRPMRDLLRRVSRRTSLHMPATGGRAPLHGFAPYRWDTTELPVTDDLYRPAGAIAQAEGLAARSAGAAATLLLTGGSTAGVHAMLLYACGRGGAVVLPRNAHLSTLNLCAVAGIEPVFAETSFTAEGRLYTTPQAFACALDARPDAAAVFALHGDYYGLYGDLPAIAREAHARGKLLLCDEAHGAYLNWRADLPNAGTRGADLFVQSAHKTLPALTAGAWLHAMAGVDVTRLRAMLRLVQTSSPSFITMLALDEARAWMDTRGRAACEALARRLNRLRAQAAPLGYMDGQTNPPDGCRYDPLRLVLRAPEGGELLAERLAERGLDVEMSDGCHIVCILPLKGNRRVLTRLLGALRFTAWHRERLAVGDLPARDGAAEPPFRPPVWPPRHMPLSQAAFSAQEPVPPSQAVGRISAACVGRYPPGVAWLTPGDEVTSGVADLICQTPPQRVFGLTQGGLLPCVPPRDAADRSND